MATSSGPSSSSSWTEDSFGLLLYPFSETEMEGTGSSVNQPPVPLANPVAPRRADPSNPVVPIARMRLLVGILYLSNVAFWRNTPFPLTRSYEWRGRPIRGQGVSVNNINYVRPWPNRWLIGRGARALDNPCTVTGEPSFGKLYSIRDSLNEAGARLCVLTLTRKNVGPEPESARWWTLWIDFRRTGWFEDPLVKGEVLIPGRSRITQECRLLNSGVLPKESWKLKKLWRVVNSKRKDGNRGVGW